MGHPESAAAPSDAWMNEGEIVQINSRKMIKTVYRLIPVSLNIVSR